MCYLRMIVYHKFYRLLSLYFVIALACKFLKMSDLNREILTHHILVWVA